MDQVSCHRVKLAVHKNTKECVAVKIVCLDETNGVTPDSLKKEVNVSISDREGGTQTH